MSDESTLPVRPLFTVTAKVDSPPPQVIAGPTGTRVVVAVSEGVLTGERVNGTVALGAGGDFAMFRPDGSLRLDVRMVVVTDDDARIYVTYHGVGRPQQDGTLALRTAPTFEASGDYAWLNTVQAVGIGVSNPSTGELRYDVYELL